MCKKLRWWLLRSSNLDVPVGRLKGRDLRRARHCGKVDIKADILGVGVVAEDGRPEVVLDEGHSEGSITNVAVSVCVTDATPLGTLRLHDRVKTSVSSACSSSTTREPGGRVFDMLYADPNGRTGLVALLLALAQCVAVASTFVRRTRIKRSLRMWCIDLQILADAAGYQTLEENLRAMRFERSMNERGQRLSWRWQTRTENGALMVVELLADAPEIAGGRVEPLPMEGNISALNIPHSSIVFDLHRAGRRRQWNPARARL